MRTLPAPRHLQRISAAPQQAAAILGFVCDVLATEEPSEALARATQLPYQHRARRVLVPAQLNMFALVVCTEILAGPLPRSSGFLTIPRVQLHAAPSN